MEAALLLPILMFCLLLTVQPLCVLYTRSVMQSAASETCRLLGIPPDTASLSVDAYKAFVSRRLEAVPKVDIFHVGGEGGWEIDVDVGRGCRPRVRIATEIMPLPLLGPIAGLMFGRTEDGNLRVEVEVQTVARPLWLEGGYGEWSSVW